VDHRRSINFKKIELNHPRARVHRMKMTPNSLKNKNRKELFEDFVLHKKGILKILPLHLLSGSSQKPPRIFDIDIHRLASCPPYYTIY
jgi:hypothetical protein